MHGLYYRAEGFAFTGFSVLGPVGQQSLRSYNLEFRACGVCGDHYEPQGNVLPITTASDYTELALKIRPTLVLILRGTKLLEMRSHATPTLAVDGLSPDPPTSAGPRAPPAHGGQNA